MSILRSANSPTPIPFSERSPNTGTATPAYVSIRQHTPAYASIRHQNAAQTQHTPRPRTAKTQHTPRPRTANLVVTYAAYVSIHASIRQHTRQHTPRPRTANLVALQYINTCASVVLQHLQHLQHLRISGPKMLQHLHISGTKVLQNLRRATVT